MALTPKTLGQSNPAATTWTSVYTVPAGITAELTCLNVANMSGSAVTFRISKDVGGDGSPAGAGDDEDYLYYDEAIPADESWKSLHLGYLEAAGQVWVYASDANMAFCLDGIEGV